jgi:preprotein translocase subunit SecY
MLEAMLNSLRSPDLRKKLLFTAFALAIYRFGSYVPVPGIDPQALSDGLRNQGQSSVLQFLNLFSGGALSRFAVFALGIMPYITASIVMQLMTVVIPKLEALQKEGEAGYTKITQYTRYFTVGLAVLQSLAYILFFRSQGLLPAGTSWGRIYLVVITLTAGTTLVMWLGELITQRGIGNGMSLLIFGSIVSGMPGGLQAWWGMPPISRIIVAILALGVTVGVVFVNEGVRRIPIQYARRVVGRRMTSGGTTYMPIRVNPQSYYFIILQALLIVLFTYFYTAIQFNPVDQAENLKKYGGFVPGVRPGRPTAVFLDRVVSRLTLPGAIYLGIIAALPALIFKYLPGQTFNFGATSILIVVAVALDTMRQAEAQLMQRNYEGFLR